MKASVFASTLLAASRAVSALPAPADDETSFGPHLDERDETDGIVETILFKRGDVLTPRDFQLAEMHGVDINTMYKHTVYKRADGDDYTVWVYNGFNETEPEPETIETPEVGNQLDARQERTRVINNNQQNYRNENGGRKCSHEYVQGTTHPSAAFTGGANVIVRWADGQNGRFYLNGGCCRDPKRVNLIIGGSNSGANLRFGVGVHPGNAAGYVWVGSSDVGIITRGARDNFQRNYGNGWRVQAHGGMRCDGDHPWPRSAWVEWVLHRSVESV